MRKDELIDVIGELDDDLTDPRHKGSTKGAVYRYRFAIIAALLVLCITPILLIGNLLSGSYPDDGSSGGDSSQDSEDGSDNDGSVNGDGSVSQSPSQLFIIECGGVTHTVEDGALIAMGISDSLESPYSDPIDDESSEASIVKITTGKSEYKLIGDRLIFDGNSYKATTQLINEIKFIIKGSK